MPTKPKRGRPRSTPPMECPTPTHRGSIVVAYGQKESGGVKRRTYRCTPRGADQHYFNVIVEVDTEIVVPAYSPPPPCPEHDSHVLKVVRDGTYGKSGHKRQRYRCYPAVADPRYPNGWHRFTPARPRDHVHFGEGHCEHCEEVRGVHRGEQTVARRQSWSVHLVAEALVKLAEGQSYSKVGKWAWERSGRTRTRPAKLSDAEKERRRKVKEWKRRVAEANVAGKKPPRRPKGTQEPLPSAPALRRRRVDADGEVLPARQRSARTKEANRRWHTAADWVEMYSSAIWNPLAHRLLAEEQTEHKMRSEMSHSRRLRDGRPQVLLLDDIPANTKAKSDGTGRKVSRRSYFILGAATLVWAPRPAPATDTGSRTQLRLLRAYAVNSADAWCLLFDELGYAPGEYEPEFIVADAGTGLIKAVNDYFTTAVFIPSLFHLSQAVEKALEETPGAVQQADGEKALHPDLTTHLTALSANRIRSMDSARWSGWWDDLETMLTRLGLAHERVAERRKNYEDVVAKALPYLRGNNGVPLSTGGFESVLRTSVKALMTGRSHGYANIERTNALLDLAVAHNRGELTNIGNVVERLRAATNAADGWGPAIREVSDVQPPAPARYSSLRDRTLIDELAADREAPDA